MFCRSHSFRRVWKYSDSCFLSHNMWQVPALWNMDDFLSSFPQTIHSLWRKRKFSIFTRSLASWEYSDDYLMFFLGFLVEKENSYFLAMIGAIVEGQDVKFLHSIRFLKSPVKEEQEWAFKMDLLIAKNGLKGAAHQCLIPDTHSSPFLSQLAYNTRLARCPQSIDLRYISFFNWIASSFVGHLAWPRVVTCI